MEVGSFYIDLNVIAHETLGFGRINKKGLKINS